MTPNDQAVPEEREDAPRSSVPENPGQASGRPGPEELEPEVANVEEDENDSAHTPAKEQTVIAKEEMAAAETTTPPEIELEVTSGAPAVTPGPTPLEGPAAEVVMEAPGEDETPVVKVEVEEVQATTAQESEATQTTMAEALEKDLRLKTRFKAGQRIEVKLVQLGDKECFLDYGGPSEGSIPIAELRDGKGNLRVKEGESFPAIVKKVGEQVEFTIGRGKGGADLLRLKELQDAHQNGIPVEGRVKGTNKGGFEVSLRGVRAFCPFSQIDTIYCDRPEDFIGRDLSFQIITFERGGRNIVLSRRRILEVDAKEAAKVTREHLEVGEIFEGKVRRLQPYGAFIDIGGLDGLVHVSEISRSHVTDPRKALKVGQAVKVQVIGLDHPGTSRERISLSMKALEDDPWSGAEETWKVGATVKGKVVRLTEFGAFVELAPGIDGLIHISEISPERIEHPRDVLTTQQEIEARVLSVDAAAHRISLSLRPEAVEASPRPRHGGGPRRQRDHDRSAGGQGMSYTAGPSESKKKPAVDVSKLDYDEALQLLKRKFNQD